MYKKFLVPMLLMAALSGCHQSSDTQTGDQSSDMAIPAQDQMANPATDNSGSDQQTTVNPQSAEPAQVAPNDSTTTPSVTTPNQTPATTDNNSSK